MTQTYAPLDQGVPGTAATVQLPSSDDESNEPVVDPSAKKFSSSKSKAKTILQKLFNISQIKELEFYQSLVSEFLGTFLLTIVCTGTGLPISSKPIAAIDGAFAAGLIVATIIVGFGHVSNAHINPAVTISFLVANKIDFIKALAYIITQLFGATCASTLVKFVTPYNTRVNLGMTLITEGVSLTQAFVIELIITFILCYTVHAISDENRNDIGGSKALAVGFAVTIGCLFGGPYTGASMNPARSFGPAFVADIWKNHWIYWYGPIIGGILAALIYTRILKTKSSDKQTSPSSS